MKKIALFFPSFEVGGVEKVMIVLANRLKSLQYEIVVIAKDRGVLRKLLYANVEVVDLGNRRIRSSLFFLKRILQEYEVDCLISGPDFPNFISIIANIFSRKKVKLIITQHCYFNIETKRLGIHGRIFPFLVKLLYHKADVVVAVSDGIKNMLKQLGVPAEKIIRIYNPIDFSLISKMACDNIDMDETFDKYIVYVGRLSHVKNVLLLIRAYALFREQNTTYKLLIIGDGEDSDNLKHEVKRKGLSENVLFTGSMINPYPYIKKASLLVLTSLSESFGNIVVEAMFLNVTVVSTQTAGVNEINGNTDSIYMVSSFQDEGVLSDIMLYAINHPKNPELLQMRANYFDANFIINEYISLL